MEVLGGDLANEMSPPCDSASVLDRPFYVLFSMFLCFESRWPLCETGRD